MIPFLPHHNLNLFEILCIQQTTSILYQKFSIQVWILFIFDERMYDEVISPESVKINYWHYALSLYDFHKYL